MARVAKDIGGRVGSDYHGIGVALNGCEVGFEVGLDLAGAISVGVSDGKAQCAGCGHYQRCRCQSCGEEVTELHSWCCLQCLVSIEKKGDNANFLESLNGSRERVRREQELMSDWKREKEQRG